MENLKKYLKNLNACSESLSWANKRKTSRNAWLSCPRGDWLLWLAGRIGIDKNLIILAACDIAESVLHLVPENEERPRKAIETARAFIAGKATIEEVRAADAAYATWHAADAAYYAANAAYAAADAAAANAAAAYAADAAASSVAAADAAAADAADAAANAVTDRDSAWAEKQKELADIARNRIPWEIWKEKIHKGVK